MNRHHKAQCSPDLPELVAQINDAFLRVTDKDWNYSRITLELRPLAQIDSPYVLWVERIETDHKTGKGELAQLKSEVTWGSRHSKELGILEIISLRLNKMLLETTSDSRWMNRRPVIRAVKKRDLEIQGITDAFWYGVQEVCGEEFNNR
jgi:hypothetical protein